MSKKLLIDTHGGISGITDFSIIIKPKKSLYWTFPERHKCMRQ